MRSKKLERCLLPEDFDATEKVAEANRKAREALQESRRAVGAAHQARREAREALDRDAQADLEAHRTGKPLPKATVPELERKADVAERAARLAQQEAAAAIDHLHELVDQDRTALIAAQTVKVSGAYDAATEAIDALSQAMLAMRDEGRRLTGLHRGDREIGHSAVVDASSGVEPALAELRQIAGKLRADATPLTTRILELVGEGASWAHVADQLGVSKIDAQACISRNWLVQTGRLRWLDHEGVPLSERGKLEQVVGVRLVPGEPYETPVGRRRRERRERQAA